MLKKIVTANSPDTNGSFFAELFPNMITVKDSEQNIKPSTSNEKVEGIDALRAKMQAAHGYLTELLDANTRPLRFGVRELSVGRFKVRTSGGSYNPQYFWAVNTMFSGGAMATEGEPGTGKTFVPEALSRAVFNLSHHWVHKARIQGNPNANEEKLNAAYDLAKLVKEGVKKVIPTYFIQSFYKMVDEDNRFPPEILSLIFTVLAESFLTYGGEDIEIPKGPTFAARNFPDSGNTDLPLPYRDRWQLVATAVGINPVSISNLLINANGGRDERLAKLAKESMVDDMEGKFQEFLDKVLLEVEQQIELAQTKFINEHKDKSGKILLTQEQLLGFTTDSIKALQEDKTTEVLLQKAFEKFNTWLATESNFVKQQTLIRKIPWQQGAITLFTEFAAQTKYCVGMASNPDHQVRELAAEGVFGYCDKCPIVGDHKDNLICNKFEILMGRGLGTRWIQDVVAMAPWAAVMVGRDEVDEEIVEKTAAAVLHDRITIHEDGFREAGENDEEVLKHYESFIEEAVYDLFKRAKNIVAVEAVKELYKDFQELIVKYRTGEKDEGSRILLAKQFIHVIKQLDEFNNLPSPSATALGLKLSEYLDRLLDEFSDDARQLIIADSE